jgi:hypothetical protein
MAAETVCPRCGHKNSFIKDVFADSCICQVCNSQLDYRQIPGAGPDCLPIEEPASPDQTTSEQSADAEEAVADRVVDG